MQKSQVECEQPSEEQSHEEDMPQSWPSFMHRAQQSPHCDGDADRPAEEDGPRAFSFMERFPKSPKQGPAPRSHTGSQSGSATPGLTQVPSTRSQGLLNCRK
jgi:hypothetical protein